MKSWQLLKQNPKLFQRYFIKEFLIKGCRKFFENRNYHELESPILAPFLPQEAYLDVLETRVEGKNFSKIMYIIPTTERYNKIALASGLGEHFVITRVARGTEELTPNHSFEFTMLEWYHLNANYTDLISDVVELFRFVHKFIYDMLVKEKLIGKFPIEVQDFYSPIVNYLDLSIDLTLDPVVLSIPDLIKQYCNVLLEDIQNEDNFRDFLVNRSINVSQSSSWQEMFEMLFAMYIEPNLPKNRLCFVIDYPKQVCVLTKPKSNNNLVCEKVEVYLAGKEIGNGYTELTDWKIQQKNFEEQAELRKKIGLKPIAFDYELIEALKSGLPNVAGIGIGLDRIAMIFAGVENISEVNYFFIV